MDTLDITRLLARDKRTAISFRGVFACDKLPVHAPTSSLYICNTHHARAPGEHWIAIYIDASGRGEFFDSFGMHPTIMHFESFLNSNCKYWMHNTKRVQSFYSDACGYHCIFYAVHRCVGFNVNAISSMYTNNCTFNDIIVKEFVRNKMNV
jgi:hypothetical protein